MKNVSKSNISVFYRNSPEYSNDQKGKLDWNGLAPLQRQATNNQANFKTSKYSTEFTYSDFPCHCKANRDKLALTNRRWMCKKGKKLTIIANF